MLPTGLHEAPREQSPGVLFALVKIPDIAGFSILFAGLAPRLKSLWFGLFSAATVSNSDISQWFPQTTGQNSLTLWLMHRSRLTADSARCPSSLKCELTVFELNWTVTALPESAL